MVICSHPVLYLQPPSALGSSLLRKDTTQDLEGKTVEGQEKGPKNLIESPPSLTSLPFRFLNIKYLPARNSSYPVTMV